jgi:hypothetical protein
MATKIISNNDAEAMYRGTELYRNGDMGKNYTKILRLAVNNIFLAGIGVTAICVQNLVSVIGKPVLSTGKE